MSREDFAPALDLVLSGKTLDAEQSAHAFEAIMTGRVQESDLADFLRAIAKRNPTVPEIVGAARTMRAHMRSLEAPADAIDLCGTGGDGHGTLNISTATAFVVAACGVPVAKHGNRSASSRTGTADVLEALGVNIQVTPAGAEVCLREAGLCFLFAPAYHTAMKHVAAVRKQLGIRTIFNLLGPLCNPAKVKRQLLGVYGREWIEPLAHVLKELGTENAWVVHGSDGLDELTTTGVTHVAALEGGKVSLREISPEEIGVKRVALAELKGGDVQENSDALRGLLSGAKGAYRDIVLLNAAASLAIADKAVDLKTGAAMASATLDSGRAKAVLEKLIVCSQRAAP
ncbi:MAG: anthranilate phosphoribosyltransferase [Proteobacteria bacterium]|nr:anthranilate phosphoribosyltransferase [Pseudomonadota bacterium]